MEDRDFEADESPPPRKEQEIPGSTREIGIMSTNVASWHSHGAAAVEAAEQCGATILCVQEVNISEEAVPGAAAAARRMGWTMIAVPQPRSRKGRTAVVLREPLSGFTITSEQSESGQLIAAEVMGGGSPTHSGVLLPPQGPGPGCSRGRDDAAPQPQRQDVGGGHGLE